MRGAILTILLESLHFLQSPPLKHDTVLFPPTVGSSQHLLARENRTRTRKESQHLLLLTQHDLPVASRTILLGITTLAVATVLKRFVNGTGLLSPKGVPLIGTKVLIGTDSGCSTKVASVCKKET